MAELRVFMRGLVCMYTSTVFGLLAWQKVEITETTALYIVAPSLLYVGGKVMENFVRYLVEKGRI